MFDKKIKVTLGGVPQLIHIRSLDAKKPILLFLHGGPGVVNRHGIFAQHSDLLDTFTMVTWDQRGSGGSCWGVKAASLHTRQLTDDAAELVTWLCKKFHKQKIFVIGGSWGSELGTWLAYRYPEQIAAYVGFGQVVDGTKNELLSYEFALDAAQKAGDARAVRLLRHIDAPEKGLYRYGFAGLYYQRRVMMRYGGYSRDKNKATFKDAFVKPMLHSGEYTPADLLGIAVGGLKLLESALYTECGAVNFPESCTEFAVPYFIFNGRHDQNTLAALVEDYFDLIRAPRKELVWFEDSGHNPMNDEPEKFRALLRQRLGEIAREENGKGVAV